MKYRKKPVIIEAVPYKPGRGIEDGIEERNAHMTVSGKGIPTPYIETLEGRHYISEGDYIITGVKGERYPCKPDIFKMTYEKVEE